MELMCVVDVIAVVYPPRLNASPSAREGKEKSRGRETGPTECRRQREREEGIDLASDVDMGNVSSDTRSTADIVEAE